MLLYPDRIKPGREVCRPTRGESRRRETANYPREMSSVARKIRNGAAHWSGGLAHPLERGGKNVLRGEIALGFFWKKRPVSPKKGNELPSARKNFTPCITKGGAVIGGGGSPS